MDRVGTLVLGIQIVVLVYCIFMVIKTHRVNKVWLSSLRKNMETEYHMGLRPLVSTEGVNQADQREIQNIHKRLHEFDKWHFENLNMRLEWDLLKNSVYDFTLKYQTIVYVDGKYEEKIW